MTKRYKLTRRQPKSTTCSKEGCDAPKMEKHKLCEQHYEAWKAEYQASYYLAHQEKAKEYQKTYNLTYKKKQHRGPARNAVKEQRPEKRDTFTIIDIRDMTGDKLARNLDRILKGERALTV